MVLEIIEMQRGAEGAAHLLDARLGRRPGGARTGRPVPPPRDACLQATHPRLRLGLGVRTHDEATRRLLDRGLVLVLVLVSVVVDGRPLLPRVSAAPPRPARHRHRREQPQLEQELERRLLQPPVRQPPRRGEVMQRQAQHGVLPLELRLGPVVAERLAQVVHAEVALAPRTHLACAVLLVQHAFERRQLIGQALGDGLQCTRRAHVANSRPPAYAYAWLPGVPRGLWHVPTTAGVTNALGWFLDESICEV
eukprot:scaffold65617_cov63-Phaeocystis_antarctica.AAC.2